jgi:hypothetical protein
LEVDQNFASSCSDIIQQNSKFSGYNMSGPYHVNVLSSQNVKDSFLQFLEDILKDIETNRRQDETAMLEDLWDDSIKIKTANNRKSVPNLITR